MADVCRKIGVAKDWLSPKWAQLTSLSGSLAALGCAWLCLVRACRFSIFWGAAALMLFCSSADHNRIFVGEDACNSPGYRDCEYPDAQTASHWLRKKQYIKVMSIWRPKLPTWSIHTIPCNYMPRFSWLVDVISIWKLWAQVSVFGLPWTAVGSTLPPKSWAMMSVCLLGRMCVDVAPWLPFFVPWDSVRISIRHCSMEASPYYPLNPFW